VRELRQAGKKQNKATQANEICASPVIIRSRRRQRVYPYIAAAACAAQQPREAVDFQSQLTDAESLFAIAWWLVLRAARCAWLRALLLRLFFLAMS
jgi:hypothetical protein